MGIKDRMLIKAEKLAGNDSKLLRITLQHGSSIIGRSLGIEYEEDEDGGIYNVLAFYCTDLNHFFVKR